MRILIVEDSLKLAEVLKRGLVRNGYAADCMHDGKEAAEHLFMNHQDYDAVILDLMLPNRSGLDICRAARERGISTPILVLTAKDEKADSIVLLNAGADDYMIKPFALEELLARLRAITRRPNEVLPSELHIQDVRLDVNTRKAYIRNDEISLTLKEFAILELFMRNQDRVLTREFILDHVWDFNFNSLSNVVDVHVKNLRQKLATTTQGDVIETVTGSGYRVKA
jgi:two-component system OmpR family response regulator